MKLLAFARELFKKFPLLFITNIILIVSTSLVDMLSIFTFVPVVDFVINPDMQGGSALTQKMLYLMRGIGLPTTLGSLMIIFLSISIAANTFQILTRHFLLRTKYALLRELILSTFTEFFRANWYFFSSSQQGTLLNTFTRELNIAGDAFGSMAFFFASILQITIFLVMPFYLSWQVTLVSILAAVTFAGPFFLLGRLGYRLGQVNTASANRMMAIIQEGLSSAKVILGFGNQNHSVEALAQVFETHRRATLKAQTLTMALPLMYVPLGLMVLTIALFTARALAIPFAEMSALLYSLFRILPYIGSLSGHKGTVDSFLPSYEQIIQLREHASQLKQFSGSRPYQGFKHQIVISDLSFAYPNHEPILNKVSLSIPCGAMVAFVGESGAGKSTLIDVIMGFNQPTTGQITIDAIPLSDFDIISYRQRIGYVPQESVLFNMTIRDNLHWANPAVPMADVEQACRLANAHEFIMEFPQGYNTVVGDRGVRLSGGQAQRLALARAILRKPDLLILDEATSALDTHSERLIQQAIENIAKETTVIVIAHRLSTIVNADYVYVLEKGRIVQQGTYTELTQTDGRFNQMVQLQFLETAR